MSFSHISWSSISNSCPRQLQYLYIEKRERVPKASMIRGHMQEAGPHSIISGMISGVSGSDPESAITQVYENNLEWFSPEEATHYKGLIKKMTDLSYRAVDDIDKSNIKPLKLQKKYQFKIAGIEYPFIGYSDLIGERQGETVILDWKSKDKAPSQLNLGAWKQQLGAYALGEMAESNSSELPVAINQVFIILKTKERVEWHQQYISADELSNVMLKAEKLQRYIELDWWPCNRDSALCTDRWCDFYSECHAETLIPAGKFTGMINPI